MRSNNLFLERKSFKKVISIIILSAILIGLVIGLYFGIVYVNKSIKYNNRQMNNDKKIPIPIIVLICIALTFASYYIILTVYVLVRIIMNRKIIYNYENKKLS